MFSENREFYAKIFQRIEKQKKLFKLSFSLFPIIHRRSLYEKVKNFRQTELAPCRSMSDDRLLLQGLLLDMIVKDNLYIKLKWN